MNWPDVEIGGFTDGSHIFFVTRVSCQVAPLSFDRPKNVSM